MNVRVVQFIDRWLGVPICFLLTLLRSTAAVFPSLRRSQPRALFIELSEMGSTVLAYSALKRFKEYHPEFELYFMIFERNREAVDLLGIIPKENVITISDRSMGRFCASTLRAILRMRSLSFMYTFDLELFSRCTAILSYISGAHERIGFHNFTAEGLYRGSLFTRQVFYNPHRHMTENFLALVLSADVPREEYPKLKADVAPLLVEPPQLRFSESELAEMRSRLGIENERRPLIVLNPDPGILAIRAWPMESFLTLSKIVLERIDARLIVLGLERSKLYAEAIQKELGAENVIDFTGKTRDLRDAALLLANCDALITNDSGVGHLASLTAIQTFVLFGPETPALYGPQGANIHSLYAGYACSPCLSAANHRRTACADNRCLQAIQPTQVARLVIRSLGSLRSGPRIANSR